MNEMRWDDVRYFLALGRNGSLAATARALGVEHSTVARRVAQLESDLEVRLFDRLARGWSLTSEGQALFDQACTAEEEMTAFQRMSLDQSALAGRVRLTAPPVLLSHFLVPHLNKFRAAYPQIELELIGELRQADMLRAEADIAIRMANPLDFSLVSRGLGTVGYGLYGVESWRVRPEDEWQFIGFDENIREHAQRQWLHEYVGGSAYALRVKDLITMTEAASNGWGVAMLPRFLAKKDKRLVSLSPSTTCPSWPLRLVMHSDVRRAPRVRCFADSLIELFSDFAEEIH